MKRLILCCFALTLFFVSGCGNAKVSGKVTLPDGSPLSKGEVIMQSDKIVAKGKIQQDGNYRMGTTKEFDGLPKGEYQVYLLSTEEYKFPGPGGKLYSAEELKAVQKGSQTASPMPVAVPRIHKKYEAISTSGLTCSVTGSMVYNIEVLPPDAK